MSRQEAEEGAARGEPEAQRSLAAYRAWDTIRANRGDLAEVTQREHTLDGAVTEEIDTTKRYEVYAWTYSSLIATEPVPVKIGYTAIGGRWNSWRRMDDSVKVTGAPGRPIMLRIWQGSGTAEVAKRSEAEIQNCAGSAIPGGGIEWFTPDLQDLDARAKAIGLERLFGVNPA